MNPGDTIYDVSLGILEPMTVVEISVTAGERVIRAKSGFSELEFPESSIGKDIFTNRPAAIEYLRNTGDHRVRAIRSVIE